MRLSRVVNVGFFGGIPGRVSPLATGESCVTEEGGREAPPFCAELSEVVDAVGAGEGCGCGCDCRVDGGCASPFGGELLSSTAMRCFTYCRGMDSVARRHRVFLAARIGERCAVCSPSKQHAVLRDRSSTLEIERVGCCDGWRCVLLMSRPSRRGFGASSGCEGV